MIDPTTGMANFNAIQIRLKPGADLDVVRDLLRRTLPCAQVYMVSTWRDKEGRTAGGRADGNDRAQHALVLDHRRGRLRHPGDLLHDRGRKDPRHRHPEVARRHGLGHHEDLSRSTGLSSGIVGAGVGMGIGLLFVRYINEIADLLGRVTGQPVFDPSIYYFQKIPTIVEGPRCRSS